jgi:hypothetical protein
MLVAYSVGWFDSWEGKDLCSFFGYFVYLAFRSFHLLVQGRFI